VIKIKNRIYN